MEPDLLFPRYEAAAIAALATAVACPLVAHVLRSAAVIDHPNERSSHSRPVPRGGGIAFFLGGAVALVLLRNAWLAAGGIGELLVGVTALGVLGFVDDVRSLPPKVRLGAQAAVCTWFALSVVWGEVGAFGAAGLATLAAVWCVTFVNSFNFMDGINGISAGTTFIIGVSLALSSIRWDAGIEVPALIVAGAAVGFAPFNLTGRLFLGDVGSYLIGSALAMLAVIAIGNGVPVMVVLLPFGVYLADVAHTLFRRAMRGAPLLQAHREHVYQRLANDLGMGHLWTTLLVAVFTASLVAIAQLASQLEATTPLVFLPTALVAIGAYLWSPSITARLRS